MLLKLQNPQWDPHGFGEELFFAGDVSKESAVLGWIVENTKDEDDPTENTKAAAEERKRADAGEELQGPRKIRTPKQEARYRQM